MRKKIVADEVRQRSGVLSGRGSFWQRLADYPSGFGDKPLILIFAFLRESQELRFEQAPLPWGSLRFAQSENEGNDAAGEKNNAGRRRQFIAAFGLDANFGVADLYAMILAVRNGHHERQHS